MQGSFNFSESMNRKEAGMAAAAASKNIVLDQARSIARLLAAQNGEVTADDVQRELERRDLPSLGPAAGSLFRTKDFVFTGKRIKSSKISNHAREIRVWALR